MSGIGASAAWRSALVQASRRRRPAGGPAHTQDSSCGRTPLIWRPRWTTSSDYSRTGSMTPSSSVDYEAGSSTVRSASVSEARSATKSTGWDEGPSRAGLSHHRQSLSRWPAGHRRARDRRRSGASRDIGGAAATAGKRCLRYWYLCTRGTASSGQGSRTNNSIEFRDLPTECADETRQLAHSRILDRSISWAGVAR